jgi:tRNA-specific 2-thiouridylase
MGHYAKVSKIEDKYILSKPKDSSKDQTYFLYTLNQYQLSKVIFPLSNLLKSEVREIAQNINLPVSNKKDSVGICFIGKQKFDTFIQNYISSKPGDMIDGNGKIVGKHRGLICYTIGQRKGIGLGSNKDSQNPWYVAFKDVKNNTLTVVQDSNHKLLMCKSLIAKEVHWTLGSSVNVGDNLNSQVRYRQKEVSCTVESIQGDSICIKFDKAQRAVTKGQSLVLYKDGNCIGGGFISEIF